MSPIVPHPWLLARLADLLMMIVMILRQAGNGRPGAEEVSLASRIDAIAADLRKLMSPRQ